MVAGAEHYDPADHPATAGPGHGARGARDRDEASREEARRRIHLQVTQRVGLREVTREGDSPHISLKCSARSLTSRTSRTRRATACTVTGRWTSPPCPPWDDRATQEKQRVGADTAGTEMVPGGGGKWK